MDAKMGDFKSALLNYLRKSAYTYPILIVVLLLGAFLVGSWYGGKGPARGKEAGGRKILHYVDPMNPAHTSPEPGLAPCGMKMEPVYADEEGPPAASGLPPGTVKVSPAKQQIIGVRLGQVERAPITWKLRTLGRVAVDEDRVYRWIAGSEGLVMEVYPKTTGSLVMKDERLATFYTTDLVSAQQTYFNSLEGTATYREAAVAPPASGSGWAYYARNQLELAIKNMENLGMGRQQIEEIARTRMPVKEIVIQAPFNSFILTRNLSAGQKFEKGQELYKLADLSRVWVVADLFGAEVGQVKPGEKVKVTAPHQGKVFEGEVSEVLPQVDPVTRAFKVRLEVSNPDYILRPDMFVDVEFPLNLPPAIAVPAEAVLDSGLKKTVFVDRGNGFFEPRQVETGRRFGERVEIERGLQAGENIVVSGNFLIDSESRMRLAAAGIFGAVAKDPACGMHVDEAKARAAGLVKEYQGNNYFFCSKECQWKFEQDPAKFAAKAEGPKETGAPHHEQHAAVQAMSKDPVCAMEVNPAKAKAAGLEVQYKGRPYHFCTEPCKRNFEKTPERYVTVEAEAPKQEAGAAQSEQAKNFRTDPVCGMDADETKARAEGLISKYMGSTFYFVSAASKQQFEQDPQRYVQPVSEKRSEKREVTQRPPTKDPVCGFPVDEAKVRCTGRTREHKGKTYFFCSDQCVQKFEKEPDFYVSKAAEEAKPVGMAASQQPATPKDGKQAPATPEGAPQPAVSQDPVCGANVPEARARSMGLVSEYQGKAYYFSVPECKEVFDKEPQKYLSEAAERARKAGIPPIALEQAPQEITAKDPVCGAVVDIPKARAAGLMVQLTRTTYYFHSKECMDKFLKGLSSAADRMAEPDKGLSPPQEGRDYLPTNEPPPGSQLPVEKKEDPEAGPPKESQPKATPPAVKPPKEGKAPAAGSPKEGQPKPAAPAVKPSKEGKAPADGPPTGVAAAGPEAKPGEQSREVTDPVCGRGVKVEQAKKAETVRSFEGTIYYFCSDLCLRSFNADPKRYARLARQQTQKAPFQWNIMKGGSWGVTSKTKEPVQAPKSAAPDSGHEHQSHSPAAGGAEAAHD